MGDPVLNTRLHEYLWNNYDLPMDAVSRAERAKKYPTQNMYSGTGEDFPAFNDAAIYATNNPDLAYTYAPSDGGNIMPLVMRAKHGAPVINAGGANWNRLTPSMREGGPQAPYLPGVLRDPEDIARYGEDILTTRDFEQAAKEQGFSGVTFNDIVDVGGYFSKYFPEGPARDAQRASMKAASEPSRVETRFYPNQVRSRFARFDPRLSHLKNLNAGVAGATAAGAGLLGYGDEANAATTAPLRADVTGAGNYSLGYEDTLGQLYRVDGGLMTPVGASADGITATHDRMEAPPEDQPEPWAIDEALRYYLGPTGIPERLAAVNEMLNPVRGMERAGEASSRMLDPDLGGLERTAAGADMLTEMLGAMLGFGGTKQAVQEAAPAVERGVLDIIDRLNQPGAMPTTYSNPIPGFLVAPADPAIQRGFRAFHGSPHDFDRFDMSKIGTGEGAQAYGHGLYFAENEGIARSYRDALSRDVFYDGNPVASVHPMDNPQAGAIHSVAKAVADGIPAEQAMAFEAGQWRAWADPYLKAAQENPQLAAEAARRAQSMTDIASAIEALDPQKFVKNPGRMYEVQINADPNNFLEWDKPLSEQPAAEAAIGRYLERALDQPGPINEDVFRRFESGEMTGADVARMVGENTAPLREAGIPGIRYLDAGSRTERILINGAPAESKIDDIAAQYINNWGNRLGRIEVELKADKSVRKSERADILKRAQDLIESGAKVTREPYGTRNYVVFDENLIEIIRKYGIAGAAVLLGVSQADLAHAMTQGQNTQSQGLLSGKSQ